MRELYIGLISGTSIDGINAALVDFSQPQPQLLATHYEKMPELLRANLIQLCAPNANEIDRLADVDNLLGKQFAAAANALLKKSATTPQAIKAIGSHGQTIRHYPQKKFTLQIGDPNVIAAETGITVVADFRRKDIALGGQGAPLVPAFHDAIFRDKTKNRIILNIGGIANVTLLPINHSTSGFDTGPGNTLLDAFVFKHLQKNFDEDGKWAASGKVIPELLEKMLQDPYFKLSPPKSTGREYFNLMWLEKLLTKKYEAQDVQATLLALTVKSILAAIPKEITSGEIFVCGGGAANVFLMEQLKQFGKGFAVYSTEKIGVHPDWVEAMAFAWLAKQTMEKKTGNLKEVTGAVKESILGGVYFAD